LSIIKIRESKKRVRPKHFDENIPVVEQEADEDSSFSDNEQYVNNPVREPEFKRFRAINGKLT
jgi:hypothetical protein